MITPFYWKLIGGGVIAVLVGVFLASWMARGREITRLADWQNTVTLATTAATVQPDAKGQRAILDPDQVPAAIAALKWSADNATAALDEISHAADRDAAVSKRLDDNLAAILAGQDRASAGTTATIRDLQARKSTGDKSADCEIMERDSNVAWNGWRN